MPAEGRGRQASVSSERRMEGTQRPTPMSLLLWRLTLIGVLV